MPGLKCERAVRRRGINWGAASIFVYIVPAWEMEVESPLEVTRSANPTVTQGSAVSVVAHRQPMTRWFHFIGTLSGWMLLLAAIILGRPWLILAALAVPYALAWISHFFIEHNRPTIVGTPSMVVAGRSENGCAHIDQQDVGRGAALREQGLMRRQQLLAFWLRPR